MIMLYVKRFFLIVWMISLLAVPVLTLGYSFKLVHISFPLLSVAACFVMTIFFILSVKLHDHFKHAKEDKTKNGI